MMKRCLRLALVTFAFCLGSGQARAQEHEYLVPIPDEHAAPSAPARKVLFPHLQQPKIDPHMPLSPEEFTQNAAFPRLYDPHYQGPSAFDESHGLVRVPGKAAQAVVDTAHSHGVGCY